MATGSDPPSVVALLGLSAHFIRSQGDVKSGIRCLQGIFSLGRPDLSPVIEARTHLQLGSLLLKESHNTDLAKHHIEQAWYQSQNIPGLEDVTFESGSVLALLFESQGGLTHAKQILKKTLETSQRHPYWHIRLLFQLASVHVFEKDLVSAVSILGAGTDYANMFKAYYTRVLFSLSKAMLLLLERNFSEANIILHQTGPLIEMWISTNSHQKEAVAKYQKEYLHMFFLVLQVCYYLMMGQVKSVKVVLKQLQQSIQTITSPGWPSDEEMISNNIADNFQWLSKEHLCILVYLVTVMHSMQAGYMDKAQKYTDKAIAQIEKMKSGGKDFPLQSGAILSTFHVLLLEHIIQCRLVTGNKSGAVQELGHLCRLLETNAFLLLRHRTQLHTLLGLYAMSMNCMDAAENQFNAALRTSQERELWTFANLNLAIVYVRSRRDGDFLALLDRISPEKLPSNSHSLQAAAYYIQGLQSFFAAKYNDSKRYLRETLKMANAEDLNRLTSCSLVLLGHIFLSLGNSRESLNMVNPAMQLASKIPDLHVQLWASAILKDLNQLTGDHLREQEGLLMHNNYSQILLKDHFKATQLPEHNLVHWTDGPFPSFASSDNHLEAVPPTTSDAGLSSSSFPMPTHQRQY
ncbi:MAU2 chromatid cohesion factor homolog isoform X2 [Lepeophtheirus salmonis]|uniref:MAU2 chromatid cohesion factor homolog n=1 Tax=Lepeophtheirus salmonis TaxID=72036 RepID=A0A0K2TGB1_LEPSM|nr:MAU2 chromatid cohesion factor homolog [Lepeophtheirus salmonis]